MRLRGVGRGERLAGVQLVHGDRPGRGRVDAQAAEDALVEVGLDDLDPFLGGRVDVDGAGVLELLRELPVARDRVVDLDADEPRVASHASPPAPATPLGAAAALAAAGEAPPPIRS